MSWTNDVGNTDQGVYPRGGDLVFFPGLELLQKQE